MCANVAVHRYSPGQMTASDRKAVSHKQRFGDLMQNEDRSYAMQATELQLQRLKDLEVGFVDHVPVVRLIPFIAVVRSCTMSYAYEVASDIVLHRDTGIDAAVWSKGGPSSKIIPLDKCRKMMNRIVCWSRFTDTSKQPCEAQLDWIMAVLKRAMEATSTSIPMNVDASTMPPTTTAPAKPPERERLV